jgi:hypothetical protein
LKGRLGSGVSLEQAKFAAEKRSLNFSNPETDLGQFVLPAKSGLPSVTSNLPQSGH